MIDSIDIKLIYSDSYIVIGIVMVNITRVYGDCKYTSMGLSTNLSPDCLKLVTYPFPTATVYPWNSQCSLETHLPTPTEGRVYVSWCGKRNVNADLMVIHFTSSQSNDQ